MNIANLVVCGFSLCGIMFGLVYSDTHNDVPLEAQRCVTIAVLQGTVSLSSSSSIKVADIIRLFFLDYTTLVAGNIRLF